MLQHPAFEATAQPANRSAAAARASAFAYQPVLDGWRAVSILLVVVSHGGLDMVVPGGLGVTIFFFISGFLITSLLISEFRRDGGISLKNFYLRRFWRLAPPLICFIILSALLMAFFAHTQRRLFLLLLILLVVPLTIRCAAVLGEPLTLIRYEYTYMATEARIDSLAWGALLAWLCSHVRPARLKALLDNEIAIGASLGLLLLTLLVRGEGFR